MGGYNAGEVASGMATTVLSTELEAAFLARSPDTRADDGTSLRPCGDPRPRHEDEFGDLQAPLQKASRSMPAWGTTLVLALFTTTR